MTATRTFDGSVDAVVRHFDAFAPDYDRIAFTGAGMAHLSSRDLAAVQRAARLAGGGRALDVGVGSGRIADALLAAGYAVTGIEASAGMRARTAERLPTVPILAGALPDELPLPDASFDLVTSLRVLKYVTDWPLAVAELSRLARPGGVVCFDLANPWSVARFGYPAGMVRTAPWRRALAALDAAGLSLVELHSGVHLPDPVWRRADHPVACWGARAAEAVLTTALGRHGARSWTFLCRRA